ncbi:hypothetical protein [Novosphingobium sp.]|uniref:hypothetical protein n=1 Tax=Novosphingobium sp. TaxID=1874826 RepID=UPI0025FA4727|nr:hypothetical protein [Novosphingobium sp.]
MIVLTVKMFAEITAFVASSVLIITNAPFVKLSAPLTRKVNQHSRVSDGTGILPF